MLRAPKTVTQFPIGSIKNVVIDKKIPAEGLKELHLDVQVVGNLMLCFDAVSEVEVIAAGEKHLLPEYIERVDDVLFVTGHNMGTYLRKWQKEKILMEIHLPVHTKLNLSFTGGVVTLNGGEGDIRIRGKFGEISGITYSKNIDVRLLAGDVSLNEVSGTANIHLSIGSITLGWTELTGTERIKTNCGCGGVTLLLPPNSVPTEDKGGFFREKNIKTSSGVHIYAKVGFGGLDVRNWS